MSPEVAQSGGPGISVLAPLSGGKQTSGERVENDANDPKAKHSCVLTQAKLHLVRLLLWVSQIDAPQELL
jgi:hypothetical protein